MLKIGHSYDIWEWDVCFKEGRWGGRLLRRAEREQWLEENLWQKTVRWTGKDDWITSGYHYIGGDWDGMVMLWEGKRITKFDELWTGKWLGLDEMVDHTWLVKQLSKKTWMKTLLKAKEKIRGILIDVDEGK